MKIALICLLSFVLLFDPQEKLESEYKNLDKTQFEIGFTKTSFSGANGFTNLTDLPRLWTLWNDLILSEDEKRDLIQPFND